MQVERFCVATIHDGDDGIGESLVVDDTRAEVERVGDLDTSEVDSVCVFGMDLFVGKKERDQFSLVVNGEELIVVFVKKRGMASDDRPVDFQPKDATFEQGCIGGRKALE
jgi:hypothetical protein